MQPYTLIGAGGAIGAPLAEMLLSQSKTVRLLSRSGKSVAGAESIAVDVMDKTALTDAVRSSKVAFLLVGLEYDIRVWRTKWSTVMDNAIAACKESGVPLIFFDNVYMYGAVEGPMTEETPFRPTSKKGRVRAVVANRLLEAVKNGEIKGTIARSADFYGPHAGERSIFFVTVLKNLAAGKKPQWIGNPSMPHTMSYTLDCARALILLAEDPESWNQTWHMPSFNPAPAPAKLVETAASMLGVPYKSTQAAPEWLVRILGLFMPVMKEFVEMMYQFDRPYHFDSSKFEKRYSFKPTPYEQGIRETIDFYQLRK